jgi:hypothetical protein
MFRLVKMRNTAEPVYFLLCMEARRGYALVTNGEDYRLSKRQFPKAAIDKAGG